jgi:hypothetical protein
MTAYRDELGAAKLRIAALQDQLVHCEGRIADSARELRARGERLERLCHGLERLGAERVIERERGLAGWIAAASLALFALVGAAELWTANAAAERKIERLEQHLAALEAELEAGRDASAAEGSAAEHRPPALRLAQHVIAVEYPAD